MKDEDLIILIETNVDKGFKELLQLYQKPIYFYIRKMVYNHDDANDVSQNVWIKVFKNLKSFKGNSKLSTWLFTIATNETLNFIKKEAKKKKVSVEDVSEQKANLLASDDLFTGDEIELLLQKSLAQLPTKQRMVFELKYYEDKKYEEISEILGTSVGALKANYHHAVNKIKEFIQIEI